MSERGTLHGCVPGYLKKVYICYNQSLRTTYNYPCVMSTFKCSANQLLICTQVVEGGGTTYGFLILLCDTMLFVGWLGPSSSRWFCCIHVIPFSPTQLQYPAGYYSLWNLIKSLILPIQRFHTNPNRTLYPKLHSKHTLTFAEFDDCAWNSVNRSAAHGEISRGEGSPSKVQYWRQVNIQIGSTVCMFCVPTPIGQHRPTNARLWQLQC